MQPIRIADLLSKYSDGTWNIYSHYMNKWHRVLQTMSAEYVYVKMLYTLRQ